MAVDMFIKIGDLKGESADATHKEEIDVLAWSWGASQSGTAGSGSGGGAGKVHVQDLTLTKYVDKSSPTLFKWCCDGTHIKDAVLTVRKAGGKALEYVKITLDSPLVTSVSTGGSGGQNRLTENISLNFSKIKIEYTPQNKDGAGLPSVSAGWDVSGNTTWK